MNLSTKYVRIFILDGAYSLELYKWFEFVSTLGIPRKLECEIVLFKGMTEDEMAGWHHWLDGHESQWTPGVGDGQGGLACCDSWGRKESDTADLIWSDLMERFISNFDG